MTPDDQARLKDFGVLLALCAVGSCFGTQCWPTIHRQMYSKELERMAELEGRLEKSRVEHDAAYWVADAAKSSLVRHDSELKQCSTGLEVLASKAKNKRLPEPLFSEWTTMRAQCEVTLAERNKAAEWLRFAANSEESKRQAYNSMVAEQNEIAKKERLPSRFLLVPKP